MLKTTSMTAINISPKTEFLSILYVQIMAAKVIEFFRVRVYTSGLKIGLSPLFSGTL
jgi:hypothetical protein